MSDFNFDLHIFLIDNDKLTIAQKEKQPRNKKKNEKKNGRLSENLELPFSDERKHL